jgi:hypothetical protein
MTNDQMEQMTMLNKSQYEKRILGEIRSLPEEALPKIVRLLSLIREEFIATESRFPLGEKDISHEKTRRLLSTSKGNWAASVIADREDRI